MASTTARQVILHRNTSIIYRNRSNPICRRRQLVSDMWRPLVHSRTFNSYHPTTKSTLPLPFLHHRLLKDTSASISVNSSTESALQLLSTYPFYSSNSGSGSCNQDETSLEETVDEVFLQRKSEVDEMYQNASSYSELNEVALAYAEELNDPIQAHEILQKIETQYANESSDLKQTLTATMKANLTCQEALYQRLQELNNDISPIDTCTFEEYGEEYTLVRKCLGEIFQFAERADWILCKMEGSTVKPPPSEERDCLYPTNFHYDSVISAFKTVILASALPISDVTGWSLAKGVPQRSTLHLQTMERLSESTPSFTGISSPENGNIEPSIDTYNNVLETWAMSNEAHFSAMAQSIFKRLNKESDFHLKPNAHTYQIMIRAWCRLILSSMPDIESSSQPPSQRIISMASFNATGHLRTMLRKLESGINEFEPSLEDYSLVLHAWSHKNESAKRSLSILKKMGKLYQGNLSDVKPNLECYKYTLLALSKSHPKYNKRMDMGKEVDSILFRMEEEGLVADTECFRAAIKTYCNAARFPRHSTTAAKNIHENACRASDYLDRMADMYHRSTSVIVKPSTVDYNNVLNAWSQSEIKGAAESAEKRLVEMGRLWKEGNEEIQPNLSSYLYVMRAWRNSSYSVSTKIDAAMSLLNRMKKEHEGGNGDCSPSIYVYNLLIAMCGDFDDQSSETLKKKCFETSVDLFKEIRNLDEVECTSSTYCFLLNNAGKLRSSDRTESSRAIESIFAQCVADGLVDEKVLRTFERLASYEIYRKIVVLNAVAWSEQGMEQVPSSGGHRSNDLILPLEWTRNVRGRNIVSISKDNVFLNQQRRSVQELKMRGIRSKKNKTLLQGGRVTNADLQWKEETSHSIL